MKKSAKTMSQHKFQKLSVQRQHGLLMALAEEAKEDGDIEGFLHRYDELHSWSRLDRYEPPAWLSVAEALDEYRIFHAGFKAKTNKEDPPTLPLPQLTQLSWQPRFNVEIVLDQVRSPYNVGSVLRLIDNLGFKGLIHSSNWLRLDHPQLRRAARGTETWIPVTYQADLPAYLKQSTVPVIAIENDTQASPVDRWQPPQSCILVLGNESYGIAAALRKCCAQSVVIPMYGFKKSMNVHHALAVIGRKIVENCEKREKGEKTFF